MSFTSICNWGHKCSVNRANELHFELQLAHKCSVNRTNELHLELQRVRSVNRVNELQLELQLRVEPALFFKISCTSTSN
jgi:hypothetical protein